MPAHVAGGEQPSRLAGRRIVLGVSGGIAAYKAVELCRRLVDGGAHVAPILTRAAKRFIGAATLSALASEPVHRSLWDDSDPIPHTRLGQSADLIVVAPATARVLADLAAGRSADLLLATLLATRAPVVLCPAMHTEMWEHPAVQHNLTVLRARGVHIVGPESGRLAGGDVGAGRLADPTTIMAAIERVLGPQDLAGLRILVTAGGTREPIDAVRFIGNRSSGKQGHALAEEAVARGASVVLVTAASPAPALSGVETVEIETAAEMQEAVLARSDECDVVIMNAAVADFRPKAASRGKLKKHEGTPEVLLEPTDDILEALGRRKRQGQTLVGFAAETDDVLGNARSKLERKNLDLIVANDVGQPGAGFAHETNAVVILDATGAELPVALSSKRQVARALLDAVIANRNPNRSTP